MEHGEIKMPRKQMACLIEAGVHPMKYTDVHDKHAQVRHLPQSMMEHGEIKMPRKQMACLMGRVFIQKSEVNLLSSVLDTPEFFWRAPDALQAL